MSTPSQPTGATTTDAAPAATSTQQASSTQSQPSQAATQNSDANASATDKAGTQPSPDNKSAEQPPADDKGGEKKPDAPKDGEPDSLMFQKKPEEKKEGEAEGDKKPEEKKDEEKKDDKKDDDKADDKTAEEKPIEYADFTLPEEVIAQPDVMNKLKEFGKENKLNQEQAQKIVDLGVELQQENLKFWNETKKAWRKQAADDKVIGGDKLDTSVAIADNIVNKFAFQEKYGGSKELLEEFQGDLMMLGLGNKRSFIRVMNNIATAIGEDKIDGKSGGNAGSTKSLAQRMYPGMPSENNPA